MNPKTYSQGGIATLHHAMCLLLSVCAGWYSAQATKFGGAQLEASSAKSLLSEFQAISLAPQKGVWGQRKGFRPDVFILHCTQLQQPGYLECSSTMWVWYHSLPQTLYPTSYVTSVRLYIFSLPFSLSPTHSLPPFPGQKLRELYVRCNQLSDFAVLQPLTELSSLKVRSIHFF